MIIDAEQHVGKVLGASEINEALHGNIFWELIPVTSEFNQSQSPIKLPYLMYHLESDGKITKDFANAYSITMWIFAKTITASAQIAKIIDDTIRLNKHRWYCRSEKSGYIDTDAKEGYIELKYNFKI